MLHELIEIIINDLDISHLSEKIVAFSIHPFLI